jgi:hypothetical protein
MQQMKEEIKSFKIMYNVSSFEQYYLLNILVVNCSFSDFSRVTSHLDEFYVAASKSYTYFYYNTSIWFRQKFLGTY